MKTPAEELSYKVGKIHHEAHARIVKAASDYDDEHTSRFEEEGIEENFVGLEEELLDVMNWAAMVLIKLREQRGKV